MAGRSAEHPRLSWQDPALRAIAWQVLVVTALALAAWYLVSNTLHNLASRNIATGFAFLDREAGFAIGETAIAYAPTDSYRRAILAGLANTMKVSAMALAGATLLGVVIGIARLSASTLVARCAAAYIECVRNVPLLLQLLLWYAAVAELLPGARAALHPFPGVYLSNRGLLLPAVESWGLPGFGLVLDLPRFSGLGFSGGASLSPELFALLAGLVTYTAAFIAEIVRSGIQSVSRGQWEAAQSIGLRPARVLRLVVLPQALRVIVPPVTSQYLNVVKNSSLAIAIGYPDLVAVVNTTLNQTGQAIEGFLIIMGVYLGISVAISLLMNAYNRHILRAGS